MSIAATTGLSRSLRRSDLFVGGRARCDPIRLSRKRYRSQHTGNSSGVITIQRAGIYRTGNPYGVGPSTEAGLQPAISLFV